jgi:DNA invertase Pin-like site-specific DNA recombinase
MQALDGVTTALELEAGGYPVAAAYQAAGDEGRPINYGFAASWIGVRMAVLDGASLDGSFAAITAAIGGAGWHGLVDGPTAAAVVAEVDAELGEGGIGIGLMPGYAPESNREEYLAMAALAARRQVPTYTHVRHGHASEPGSCVEGVGELVHVAAMTGAHMHLCHVNSTGWRRAPELLELLGRAQGFGLRLSTEMYPWGAASRGICQDVPWFSRPPGGTMDIGLARVSTRDQSPGLQLNALEQAGCSAIYEERVSGVSAKRPVRDQVLAELQPGDTLTVWKLDRLGRSMVELLDIIGDLTRRGVRFRCLTQPIDTSSPTGRLFLTFLAGFAEFEREIMRERVLAGKERQRAEGRPMGRLPFGWTDADTVNEEQAALLREAAARLLDGVNVSTVVDDWNAAGIPPERGRRWSVTPLQRMLTNPRTAAILGPDIHAAILHLFSNRRRRQGRSTEHLLSGILVCQCEQAIYADVIKGHAAYRCRKVTHSGGRSAGCGRLNISERAADRVVAEMFIAAVCSETFAAKLDERRAELLAGDTTAEQLEDWRQEIAELGQVLETRYGTDEHRRRRAELERIVRRATARLMARPELQALYDLPRTEIALRARWDGWTIVERRTWLRRVLDRVIVKPATSVGRGSDIAARLDPRWRI